MKILLLLLLSFTAFAQMGFDIDDDDLSIGGDIFSDFNEDLENQQIVEDERFYRFGRFYSFSIGAGYTDFLGNRGAAYGTVRDPSLGMQLNYFSDFHNSYGIGFQYSKHNMFLKYMTNGLSFGHDIDDNLITDGAGWVDVRMLRLFFAFRHYFDTSNLGTAITWANPYIAFRMEYWYVTNRFTDQDSIGDFSGGGFGFSAGAGLEFPIKIKKSYVGLEALIHTINFHDKYTSRFAPSDAAKGTEAEGYGYTDLTGFGLSFMINYVMSW